MDWNDLGGGTTWVVWLAILVVWIVAMWKIYAKADQPGWAAIIPIYNIYIWCKIVGRPGWWVILLFIPFVNIVIDIILSIDLAKSYGKGAGFGIGIFFLPFIFLLILGFGSAKYEGHRRPDRSRPDRPRKRRRRRPARGAPPSSYVVTAGTRALQTRVPSEPQQLYELLVDQVRPLILLVYVDQVVSAGPGSSGLVRLYILARTAPYVREVLSDVTGVDLVVVRVGDHAIDPPPASSPPGPLTAFATTYIEASARVDSPDMHVQLAAAGNDRFGTRAKRLRKP